MILRRLGNKSKISKEIQQYFPPHKIYIEPFFGAGGMFFNKPKAKYNIVNDLDSDVFNLFQVVMNQKEELEKAFYIMPIHSDLLEYWKQNKETDPIKKALRFLFLSNLTFHGAGASLRFGARNDKESVYNYLDDTFNYLKDVQFKNEDFKTILNGIEYRDIDQTFIYCDPPYIDTGNNYSNSFSIDNTLELFKILYDSRINFAVSEFNTNLIYDIADNYNLNVITIGERQNLKNRRTEILITNYINHPTLF